MKKTVNVSFQLLVLLSFLILSCSPNSNNHLAGGATGTEVSAVMGTIIYEDGSPAAFASIRLRPIDYIADSSASISYCSLHSIIDAKTDSLGQYRIDSVIPGSYRIEAVSSNDTFGVIIDVYVVTDSSVVYLHQSKLQPMAEITGEIQINQTAENRAEVQVYGIERDVVADSNGRFRIRIPVGTHNLHIKTTPDSPAVPVQNIESMDVHLRVKSGERRDIGKVQIDSPQSMSCPDGKCDSLTLLEILDTLNLEPALFDSVSQWKEGRIVALNFRNIKVQYLPRKIMKLTKVTSMDLGKTGIGSLNHEFGPLRNLEALYLDSNMLSDLPPEVSNLNSCRILDLSGNMFRHLPGAITRLYPAEFLNLSGNRLCTLDSSIVFWATKFDPDWKETQICN